MSYERFAQQQELTAERLNALQFMTVIQADTLGEVQADSPPVGTLVQVAGNLNTLWQWTGSVFREFYVVGQSVGGGTTTPSSGGLNQAQVETAIRDLVEAFARTDSTATTIDLSRIPSTIARVAGIQTWALSPAGVRIPADSISQEVTGRLIPSGGSTGQVLAKASNTNYLLQWVDAAAGGLNDTQVRGLIADWAETGNLGVIPANKLSGVAILTTDLDTYVQDWAQAGNNTTIPAAKLDAQALANKLNGQRLLAENSLTTSVVNRLLPSGGSDEQVLAKSANGDYEVEWTSVGVGPQGPPGAFSTTRIFRSNVNIVQSRRFVSTGMNDWRNYDWILVNFGRAASNAPAQGAANWVNTDILNSKGSSQAHSEVSGSNALVFTGQVGTGATDEYTGYLGKTSGGHLLVATDNPNEDALPLTVWGVTSTATGQVDEATVRALVWDWAESDNHEVIPNTKISNLFLQNADVEVWARAEQDASLIPTSKLPVLDWATTGNLDRVPASKLPTDLVVDGDLAGGTTNQVLTKTSNDGGVWAWRTPVSVEAWARAGNTTDIPLSKLPFGDSRLLPSGGTAGQVLTKDSQAWGDSSWQDAPTGGTATNVEDWATTGNLGQIPLAKIPNLSDAKIPSNITRDSEVEEFARVGNATLIPDTKIPTTITRDSELESFARADSPADVPQSKLPFSQFQLLPAGGTPGQVLARTTTASQWVDPATGTQGETGPQGPPGAFSTTDVGSISLEILDADDVRKFVTTGITGWHTYQWLLINFGSSQFGTYKAANWFPVRVQDLVDLAATSNTAGVAPSTSLVFYRRQPNDEAFWLGRTATNELLFASNSTTFDAFPLTVLGVTSAGGTEGGLDQTAVRNLIADWAEQGNNTAIPVSKFGGLEDWTLRSSTATISVGKLPADVVLESEFSTANIQSKLTASNLYLVPGGGTSGQVLTKSSSTSGQLSWTTPASGGGGSVDLSQIQDWAETGNTSRLPKSKLPTDTFYDADFTGNTIVGQLNSASHYTVPAGGTSGQVLAKSANNDGSLGWITPTGPDGGISLAEARAVIADWAEADNSSRMPINKLPDNIPIAGLSSPGGSGRQVLTAQGTNSPEWANIEVSNTNTSGAVAYTDNINVLQTNLSFTWTITSYGGQRGFVAGFDGDVTRLTLPPETDRLDDHILGYQVECLLQQGDSGRGSSDDTLLGKAFIPLSGGNNANRAIRVSDDLVLVLKIGRSGGRFNLLVEYPGAQNTGELNTAFQSIRPYLLVKYVIAPRATAVVNATSQQIRDAASQGDLYWVPGGGSDGQILAKASDASGVVEWVNAPTGTGSGLNEAQVDNRIDTRVLNWARVGNDQARVPDDKIPSGIMRDSEYTSATILSRLHGANHYTVPSGGTTGQVLRKTSNTSGATSWQSFFGIPVGGATGQVLAKTNNSDGQASWNTIYQVPAGGLAGHTLTKTGTGAADFAWAGPITEIGSVNPITFQSFPLRTNITVSSTYTWLLLEISQNETYTDTIPTPGAQLPIPSTPGITTTRKIQHICQVRVAELTNQWIELACDFARIGAPQLRLNVTNYNNFLTFRDSEASNYNIPFTVKVFGIR